MQVVLKLIMLFATVSSLQGFSRVARPARNSLRSLSMSKGPAKGPFQLVLLRHGESTWNDENKFTGWYDCPLSEKGRGEAASAGKLLAKNGFHFDLAYSSFLQRAIRTLWYSLEETGHMYIPIKTAWQLNERHYGSLQGLDKQQTVDKYGKDQVDVWRRSYGENPLNPPIPLNPSIPLGSYSLSWAHVPMCPCVPVPCVSASLHLCISACMGPCVLSTIPVILC
jgi:hypothetical protein